MTTPSDTINFSIRVSEVKLILIIFRRVCAILNFIIDVLVLGGNGMKQMFFETSEDARKFQKFLKEELGIRVVIYDVPNDDE